MKVMAREGQFKWNKDGVPTEGGRRRVGTRGDAGRKIVFFILFFLLNLRQETECLVGTDGWRWESGENRK